MLLAGALFERAISPTGVRFGVEAVLSYACGRFTSEELSAGVVEFQGGGGGVDCQGKAAHFVSHCLRLGFHGAAFRRTAGTVQSLWWWSVLSPPPLRNKTKVWAKQHFLCYWNNVNTMVGVRCRERVDLGSVSQ